MKYTKPELNLIGEAETLILGKPAGNDELGHTRASSAFEFEE
jgi:hypothetical protein